jgi:hypothetical protein
MLKYYHHQQTRGSNEQYLKSSDVIIKRWQNFTGKEAMLEATGKTYRELTAANDGDQESGQESQ